MTEPVGRAEFEASVRKAIEGCRSVEGIHGPGSTSWRLGRESILFLGGGSASLLQLAHPFVAHAIDHHSETQRDPVGRFNRTFQHVYAMVFGRLEDAQSSALRVRAIHEHITGELTEDLGQWRRGDRYYANDPDALLWVHATLVYTSVQVYELCVEPLSEADKDLYWLESKRFARLFGVPESILPEDWSDFLAYWDRAVASLAVGTAAKQIARFLLSAPRPSAVPIMRAYRIVTAGLLPESLREPYDLRFDLKNRLVFEGITRSLATAYRRMPRRLRDVPAFVEAWSRLEGDAHPDRFGRALERAVLKIVQPVA